MSAAERCWFCQRETRQNREGGRCAPDARTKEHLRSLSRGGHRRDFVWACAYCNTFAGNADIEVKRLLRAVLLHFGGWSGLRRLFGTQGAAKDAVKAIVFGRTRPRSPELACRRLSRRANRERQIESAWSEYLGLDTGSSG